MSCIGVKTPGSRGHPETVVHRVDDLQLRSQIPFRRRDIRVAEQQLNLFEIASSGTAQLRERASAVMSRERAADRQATNVARYIRIPGSVRTDNEATVEWTVETDGSGRSPQYTLNQLAEFFAVKLRPRDSGVKERKTRKKQGTTQRCNGYRALPSKRLSDIEKLLSLRGWKLWTGIRNNGLLAYALVLKQNGRPQPEVQRRIEELARNCRPPLPAAQVRAILSSVFEKRYRRPIGKRFAHAAASRLVLSPAISRLTNQTISDYLDISRSEANALEYLGPAAIYKSARVTNIDRSGSAKQSRSDRIRLRQEEILRIMDQGDGEVPSCRKMAELLKKAGYKGGHDTVNRDYRALGLQTGTVNGGHMPRTTDLVAA